MSSAELKLPSGPALRISTPLSVLRIWKSLPQASFVFLSSSGAGRSPIGCVSAEIESGYLPVRIS